MHDVGEIVCSRTKRVGVQMTCAERWNGEGYEAQQAKC